MTASRWAALLAVVALAFVAGGWSERGVANAAIAAMSQRSADPGVYTGGTTPVVTPGPDGPRPTPQAGAAPRPGGLPVTGGDLLGLVVLAAAALAVGLGTARRPRG